MLTETIKILLIDEDNALAHFDRAELPSTDDTAFVLVRKSSAEEGLQEFVSNFESINIVAISNSEGSREDSKTLRLFLDQGVPTPVMLIVAERNFDIVVEAMKYGVKDILLRSDVTPELMAMSAASAIERVRSARRLSNPEISAARVAAMQRYVGEMSQDFMMSLEDLRSQIGLLFHDGIPDNITAYLKIINDNLDRMEKRIHQLRALKQDKTVLYVKNIRMIDLT